MATQTYSGLANLQRNFYEGVTLKRLLPFLPMFGEGQKGTIPERNGTTTEWRAWASLSLATTALTEGTPPTENALTITKVTATVLQYGAWVKASDLLVHQGIDPVWTNIAGLLGEQAGASLHTVLVNVLAGGTTVQYASTAVSRVTVAAGMVLTAAEVQEMVATLEAANVPKFSDGFYHALIHTRGANNIRSDTLWQDISKYNGGSAGGMGGSLLSGEIGALHGVKFAVSTHAPVFAGAGAAGIDVYGTLIYGPDWFGQRSLAAYTTPSIDPKTGMGVRVDGVPVDRSTKDDPLGQFGVLGWKTSFVAKILQEARGGRIEHSIS